MKVFDFINHASIKCEYGGLILLTDPWYISNAFGSWFQNPSPLKSDIYEIIDNNEEMAVVTSHGHDDHIDDWFIGKHLRDKIFYCPKFETPGLENRLKNLNLNVKTIENPSKFGDFIIQQFVNPDFTKYDAVVTIKTPDFIIIHANDNYHAWPEKMMLEIKKLCHNYSRDNIYLLIQFGVADCFPVNYENIDSDQAYKIINKRFESYYQATEKNMNNLEINKMYYYANQSLFKYKHHKLNGKSMYKMALEFLTQKKSGHTQLLPGMSVHQSHQIVIKNSSNIDIFNYCLKGLENFVNSTYEEYTGDKNCLKVSFITSKDELVKNNINYIADNEIWNRILIGELTLESIIIGGAGKIFMPVENMRDHFFFVLKRSYIAQNKIKKIGLSFFREFNYET